MPGVVARVLPLALVVGLFGASQSETAGALGPAILLSITVAPAVTTITQGATQQFTATGAYSDLSTKDLTDTVTWSSSSSSIATVSNAPSSQGLATAVGTGVATITASDPASPLAGTAALTVTPAVPIPTTTTLPTIPTTLPTIPSAPAILVSVTVTPAVANVAVGAGEQFTATGTYSDLSTRDLTDSVTWASSSSSTATVSNTPGSRGHATGVAEGATTITATDPGALISGTAALTVTPAPPLPAVLVSVTVAPAVANVAVGAGEQFTATGTYSDLSTRDLTESVVWSSSSASTATVSNTPGSRGLATGVADGVATIAATDAGTPIPGTAELTVTPVTSPVTPAPRVPHLALTPASGKRKAPILARGSGFTPGNAVTITYLSGLKAHKRARTVLCRAVAASNGTFSCHGTVPRLRRSGKKGNHTIEATGASGGATTSKFTLVRR